MELEITYTIYIDVDTIIQDGNLTSFSTKEEIYNAISNYHDGLDDCDYYALGQAEIDQIYKEIISRIGEQLTLAL